MTAAHLTVETVTVAQVAKMIDHSLLQPPLTTADVQDGCDLAARYDVASVCVRPSDVPLSVAALAGTDVFVCTVVGFPHGSTATATKVFETRLAVEEGAREIDMVLHIGRLRGGDLDYVASDIRAVVEAAGVPVKVILENAYLTDDQKVTACRIAEAAGAAFVKTSTGYAPSGATLADVVLMAESVSPAVQVKAAGGVRTLDTLLEMANVGVTRFGASATAAILDDLAHRQRHGVPLTGARPSSGY